MGLAIARPEEARQELARRMLARRRLVDFQTYVSPWYRPARHQRFTAEMLEQVELYVRTRGMEGIGRLLILEPPRHGKSEQVSRHFPAWFLGRNPEMRVILTSYGAELAARNSRAARDIVDGGKFRAVFGELATIDVEAPVMISDDSRSVQAWDLAAPHRGGLQAAGIGGALTGSGAQLLIVDDPLKNREESESEAHRERVWEWWTSTAYTRLEDGAAVVGMLTRWHGDDWAGRLIRAMATDPAADQWVIVCLPDIWEPPSAPEGKTFDEYRREMMLDGVWIDAEDPLGREPGEALWPEKYGVEDLARIAANIGGYDYQALYRQTPYSRKGNMFKREWFTVVDAPPKAEEVTARIRVWDKAGSQDGSGDYACGVLLALTKDELVYVEHVAREQGTPAQRDELINRTAEHDRERKGPRVEIWHQQDPGSAGLDSAMATNRMLAKKGYTVHFETMSGEKEVRAGPWSSALEGGMVRLVRAAWNGAFIEEHVAFPKGRYDDQVDAASWGFLKLTGNLLPEVEVGINIWK